MKRDLTLWSLVPAAVLLALTLITGVPVIGLLFFVLTFTAFDVLGFDLTKRDPDPSVLRTEYRIAQVIFQFVALALVLSACGWVALLAAALAWWFTACDRLYYVMMLEPDYGGRYTWLEGWSVFWVLNRLGVEAWQKSFNIVSVVGTALTVAMCTVLHESIKSTGEAWYNELIALF